MHLKPNADYFRPMFCVAMVHWPFLWKDLALVDWICPSKTKAALQNDDFFQACFPAHKKKKWNGDKGVKSKNGLTVLLKTSAFYNDEPVVLSIPYIINIYAVNFFKNCHFYGLG